ncbi:MAG: sulfite exporter TauE/SafE family protein [Rubricoccaceae bacterium]|nr:sulfite exporter TauE/SafE family protein [Rubricoccaceae bacterium]
MLLLLLMAGLVGGFLAGLVGVGGGVVFGPVLFFYFQALGIEDPALTPLTLGTSLLCTLCAALSGTVGQWRAGAIAWRTALVAGAVAAVAVTAMGLLVTTQPWYSKQVFQGVLATVLLVVVARMLLKREARDTLSTAGARRGAGVLAATGASAGAVAAAAGVGGGVVLVPAFNTLLRLPLKVAAGTSTAAIVLISLSGVLVYGLEGMGVPGRPLAALGYVDALHGAALALPAVLTAGWGVKTAHRINVRWVQVAFALLAFVVAVRLIWNVLAG